MDSWKSFNDNEFWNNQYISSVYPSYAVCTKHIDGEIHHWNGKKEIWKLNEFNYLTHLIHTSNIERENIKYNILFRRHKNWIRYWKMITKLILKSEWNITCIGISCCRRLAYTTLTTAILYTYRQGHMYKWARDITPRRWNIISISIILV